MPTDPKPGATPAASCALWRVDGDRATLHTDFVASEQPLEIQLSYEREGVRVSRAISVTMRTPGADRELAAGYLFTEGVLSDRNEVEAIEVKDVPSGATVSARLRAGADFELAHLQRSGPTTSACGVCGKTSLAAVGVRSRFVPAPDVPSLRVDLVHQLAGTARAAQSVFHQTGGLHAAGLFDAKGALLDLQEDIGRHNAVDKLIGGRFLAGQIPLLQHVLFVSGRPSFELVQKAAMAGIPVLVGVGAPSSLAVSLARDAGMTLVGFVRGQRFNVYSGVTRFPQLAGLAVDDGSRGPGGKREAVLQS